MQFDDEITPQKYKTLCAAGGFFLDQLFDAVAHVSNTEDYEPLLSWLPLQFSRHYTPLFAKKFLVCTVTVIASIDKWDGESAVVSCTAEALALRAVIQTAQDIIQINADSKEYAIDDDDLDFSAFEDLMLLDADIDWLFHFEWDGIEDTELADYQGMMLRPEEWFIPYGVSDIHPYCRDS